MKREKIVNLASAWGHKFNVIGLLPPAVTKASNVARTTFIVLEELGTDVIIGCQYIDAAVNEINVSKLGLLGKSDAFVTIQKRCAHHLSSMILLEQHQFKHRVKKSLDFVCVVKSTVIPVSTEGKSEVQCFRSRMLILETADELYTKRKTDMADASMR